MNALTPDLLHNSKMIQFSLGTGDNLGKPKNTKEAVKKFKGRFSAPMVTPEKYREYKAATDKRQRFLTATLRAGRSPICSGKRS